MSSLLRADNDILVAETAFIILQIVFYLSVALYAEQFNKYLIAEGIQSNYMNYLRALAWITFGVFVFGALFSSYLKERAKGLYTFLLFVFGLLLIADMLVLKLFYEDIDPMRRELVMPYIHYWHVMAIIVIFASFCIASGLVAVWEKRTIFFPRSPPPPPPKRDFLEQIKSPINRFLNEMNNKSPKRTKV